MDMYICDAAVPTTVAGARTRITKPNLASFNDAALIQGNGLGFRTGAFANSGLPAWSPLS